MAYLVVGLGTTLVGASARAMDYKLGPGEAMTLGADLQLQLGDTLVFRGTPDNPCSLMGGGFTISTVGDWQGDFIIENCTVNALGAATPEKGADPDPNHVIPQMHKMAIDIGTNGMLSLVGDVFHRSGGIALGVGEKASVQILNNTIAEDSAVDVFMNSTGNSQAAIEVTGSTNTSLKVIQGNKIFKSGIHFRSTMNWLVGGNMPGQGNIIAGPRGGISSENAHQIQIIGNYLHATLPLDGWNQVKTLGMLGDGFVVEHNVLHGGNWLVDVAAEAEIRYNLFLDSYDRPWLLLESTDVKESVHHNIFIRTDPVNLVNQVSGVWVYHRGGTTPVNIFNNTFHGGGKCWGSVGPAVAIEREDMPPNGFVDSLRSNVFTQFAIDVGMNGDATAAVRGGGLESGGYEAVATPPVRLGYADYNLFFNPDAARKDNYAVLVQGGLREGMDPGFAAHDPPANGSLDQQVDPAFTGVAQPMDAASAGKIPIGFPYALADIKAGTTTVCQILRFYQQVFTPAAGSPLIDTGDPADGAGNDIGAIGAGAQNAADGFASICPPGDVGTPDTSAAVFTCPKPPVGTGGNGGGGGGGGGTGGVGGHPPSPGFICVCDASNGPSPAGVAGALLVFAAILVSRRRRRAPVPRRGRTFRR